MAFRTALAVSLWVLLGGGTQSLANGDAAPEAPADASPAARLADGGEASEYWDLAAVFDSGHRIFGRFQVSNEGPGDRTGYALGQVVFPDGRVVPFQNGRLEGSWEISDDRLRLEIGSSILDLHGPSHHFEVDKSKKGIKLFLDYEGTGRLRTWETAPPGYHLDLVTLGGAIRGTLWVRDVTPEPVPVSGRVTVTHAWMKQSEYELARLRVESYLRTTAGAHVYAVAVEPEKGQTRTWMVVRDGERWAETQGFDLDAVGRDESSASGYPIPQHLALAGPGVEGRIDVGRLLVRHDPLDLAPGPFRFFLSFRTEPSQSWLASRHRLEWLAAGERSSLAGDGVSSFYYLNPRR